MSEQNQLMKPAEDTILGILSRRKDTIKEILGAQFDVQRYGRLIITAIRKTPKLAECTPLSVINSVLNAASLGLEIRNNQAYLLPYGKDCQLVIDYRGKIELAKRSGYVDDISAHLIYSRDHLVIQNGLQPRFEHVPAIVRQENSELVPVSNDDRGSVVAGYGIAWLKGVSRPHIELMSIDDINRVFKHSKGAWWKDGNPKKDSPWHTDFPQMARKTLIHRLCNYIPQSRELSRSQEIDLANEGSVPLEPLLEVTCELEERPMIAPSTDEQNRALESRLLQEGTEPERVSEILQGRLDKQAAKANRTA